MADKSVLLMPGDQTAAQALLMSQAFGRRSSTPRRKRAKRGNGSYKRKRTARRQSSGTRSKSRGRKGGRGGARLVKGSAAAKRHMAKLRRMRRK